MKISWKSVAGVAVVAALAFGAVAVRLSAKPAAGGSFNLPFDAQWGIVSLPRADYTFAVDHITSTGAIVVYREGRPVGIVRSQVLESAENKGETAELFCVRHEGKFSVRALKMPRVGTFYFPLPKGLTVMAAKQPELIETVSVQVSGE